MLADHERDPVLGVDAAQEIHDAARELRVEARGGLVGEDHRRRLRERARDRDALLLTAGELVDPLALGAGKPDALEHRVDAARDLRARDTATRKAVADVFADAHHREQREVLEHHVDGPAIRRHAAHRLAADRDGSGVGRKEARDHPQQRRLAAARGAEERDQLTLADLQVDLMKHRGVAIADHHLVEGEI